MPTRRARFHDAPIMEFGARIIKVAIMELKKEGDGSMIIIRFGADGSLCGSLMVTIICSR